MRQAGWLAEWLNGRPFFHSTCSIVGRRRALSFARRLKRESKREMKLKMNGAPALSCWKSSWSSTSSSSAAAATARLACEFNQFELELIEPDRRQLEMAAALRPCSLARPEQEPTTDGRTDGRPTCCRRKLLIVGRPEDTFACLSFN